MTLCLLKVTSADSPCCRVRPHSTSFKSSEWPLTELPAQGNFTDFLSQGEGSRDQTSAPQWKESHRVALLRPPTPPYPLPQGAGNSWLFFLLEWGSYPRRIVEKCKPRNRKPQREKAPLKSPLTWAQKQRFSSCRPPRLGWSTTPEWQHSCSAPERPLAPGSTVLRTVTTAVRSLSTPPHTLKPRHSFNSFSSSQSLRVLSCRLFACPDLCL